MERNVTSWQEIQIGGAWFNKVLRVETQHLQKSRMAIVTSSKAQWKMHEWKLCSSKAWQAEAETKKQARSAFNEKLCVLNFATLAECQKPIVPSTIRYSEADKKHTSRRHGHFLWMKWKIRLHLG